MVAVALLTGGWALPSQAAAQDLIDGVATEPAAPGEPAAAGAPPSEPSPSDTEPSPARAGAQGQQAAVAAPETAPPEQAPPTEATPSPASATSQPADDAAAPPAAPPAVSPTAPPPPADLTPPPAPAIQAAPDEVRPVSLDVDRIRKHVRAALSRSAPPGHRSGGVDVTEPPRIEPAGRGPRPAAAATEPASRKPPAVGFPKTSEERLPGEHADSSPRRSGAPVVEELASSHGRASAARADDGSSGAGSSDSSRVAHAAALFAAIALGASACSSLLRMLAAQLPPAPCMSRPSPPG